MGHKAGKVVGLIVIVLGLSCGHPSEVKDESLFLTPFLKSGDIMGARKAAEDSTRAIQASNNISSFSGYLTIDDESYSNIFFWFFPAKMQPDLAPIILVISDFPGYSVLKSVFLETGPFVILKDNIIAERNFTWTRSHSVLYIDSPVGTGFSFASSSEGYAKTVDDEAKEVYIALKQFFTLFQEYSDKKFYIAGERIAALLISHIAKHIEMNSEGDSMQINLKGCIIGSPYISVDQPAYTGNYLYNLGLIDDDQRQILDGVFAEGLALINAGQVAKGTKIIVDKIYGPRSLVNQFSGLKECRNGLIATTLPDEMQFLEFITTKAVHKYLHVGLHNYTDMNFAILGQFAKEVVSTHGDVLTDMLEKNYKILLYSAQFDIQTTHQSVVDVVKNLKWSGIESFWKEPRQIWRVDDDVAGYIRSYKNLMYALIRNAGNFAIRDQPEWTLNLIEKFTSDKW